MHTVRVGSANVEYATLDHLIRSLFSRESPLDFVVETAEGERVTRDTAMVILFPDEFTFEGLSLVDKKPSHVLSEQLSRYKQWLNSKHDEFTYKALGNPSASSPAGWPRNLELARRVLANEKSDELTIALNAKLTANEKAQDNAFLLWAAKVVYVKAPFTTFVYDEAEGVKRYGEKLGEAITVDNANGDIKAAFDAARLAVTIEGLGQEYIDSNKQQVGGRMLAAMQYLAGLKEAFPAKYAKHLTGEV